MVNSVESFNNTRRRVLDILKAFKNQKEIPRSINLEVLKSLEKTVEKNQYLDLTSLFSEGSHRLNFDSEFVPLTDIAIYISAYLFNHSISVQNHIRLLQAFTYHGLFDLYEIIKDKIDISQLEKEDLFNLYKARAKYYKVLGNFSESQKHYRKTILIGKEINMLPFAYSLQSKLFSDYLQREGLCFAYGGIAYKKATKSKKLRNHHLRFHIIADTYAKQLFKTDNKRAIRIYKKILNSNKVRPSAKIRADFRFLESYIENKLFAQEFENLKPYFHRYEELLEQNPNNPKPLYIREIILIGFYRRIGKKIALFSHAKEKKWFEQKFNTYKEGKAIYILDKSIERTIFYNDRRFYTLALYEKSFWLEKENLKIAIDSLKLGLKAFSKDENETILNKIYCDFLERLGDLSIRKRVWSEALSYYEVLYHYIDYLQEKLREDKSVLSEILTLSQNERGKKKYIEYIEYIHLNKKEIEQLNLSIIRDYEKLINRLIDSGRSIKSIQNLLISDLLEAFKINSGNFVHDFRKDINGMELLYNEIVKSYNTVKLREQIEMIEDNKQKIKNQLDKTRKRLNGFEDIIVDQITRSSTSRFDLNKEILNTINLHKKSIPSEVTIEYEASDEVQIELNKYILSSLIENLIDNAIYVGSKNKVSSICITFGSLQDDNSVFLNCKDNCGDIKKVEKVIDSINHNKKPLSTKNPNEIGQGLLSLRKLLRKAGVTSKWTVSGDNDLKSIQIPLFKMY